MGCGYPLKMVYIPSSMRFLHNPINRDKRDVSLSEGQQETSRR